MSHVAKILEFFFGSILTAGHVLGLILNWRGWLPFSGVRVTMPRSKSMPVHLRVHAPPTRAPVSFNSRRTAEALGPVPLLSASLSASNGMKGNVSTRSYRGFQH